MKTTCPTCGQPISAGEYPRPFKAECTTCRIEHINNRRPVDYDLDIRPDNQFGVEFKRRLGYSAGATEGPRIPMDDDEC